jgi:hypothetical protein
MHLIRTTTSVFGASWLRDAGSPKADSSKDQRDVLRLEISTLLYAVTGFSILMLSVSGRLRNSAFGPDRVDNETPPFKVGKSNSMP